MTINFGRKYFLLIALSTFLWNQQASILSQKIAIENSYQQKVTSAVSRMLGQEKFLVIVSIDFSSIGGTLKKTATPQTGVSSTGGYIPGLPTVPSTQGSPPSYGSNTQKGSGNDLDIGRVDVTIGMDETSITGSVKQEIKSLVEKIIPQTKDCSDCIKIEAMQFQTNQKNVEIETLRRELDSLQSEIRGAKLDADAQRLKDLDAQLTEVRQRRDDLESIEDLRKLHQIKEDSIRFSQLVAAERARKTQDSLKFVNTEKRLERVMESKIKSDSVIIHETLSIVKQQAGVGEKEDESLLGMQLGSGSSGIMGSVIFILLIIALMVVTFLAASNKKPKTIYLKPKGGEKEKPKEKKKEKKKEAKKDPKEDESEKEDEKPEEIPKPAAPPPPRPDEDAMRSELRSLRQTAVSLTVGEKEGASALIKEWMEDNPNKSDAGEEEAGEE
ncbi:MAG: hypothetical protein H8E85_04975 [Candidatus Marinimicrobia bacterium]|nr:hypothetical protein [Candidatus Neomarinimicrobiota bacterium]